MHYLLYWGIFLSFSCGDDYFLTDLLQSSLLSRVMVIRIIGHCFDDFCRDKPLEDRNLRVLAVPLSMTLP